MLNRSRTALRYLISVGLLLLGTPISAQPNSYEAARAQLDDTMAEIQAVRDSLDRTTFDLDALGMELFFAEPDEIGQWVADNVAYQPYRGVLRGAQGTLLARAGNALDQSVLLATLLTQAGFEARIALGQLSPDQAGQLLETTSAAPKRDYSELRSRLEGLPGIDVAGIFDASPDQSRLALTDELSSGLLGALSSAQLELAAEQPSLLEEAAAYAWVEYQLAGDEWEEAHPAAPFLAGAGLEATSHLVKEVPAELQHRVRFEVLVESLMGSELTVKPVMPAWERPAANTIGTIIDYSNVPNTADMNTDIATVLSESEFWVPTFMDGMPDGAQAFDMTGALLSPEDAANPMAGVFRAVRGGFMDAIGALGSMGGDDAGEAAALTAQWLKVTLVAPDGSEREFRRTVFDRIGEDARAAGLVTTSNMTIEEAELSLLGEHRLMIFPAELPLDYLVDGLLGQMLESRPLLERALALSYGVEPKGSLEDALAENSPIEHLLTMQEFDQGPADGFSWRAEPGLIMFSDALAGTPDDAVIVSRLDIMNNARRVAGPAATTTALSQGVWETLTERDLLQDFRHNTANFGTDLQVIAPGVQIPDHLSAEARHNLERDLDEGYVVVLPAGAEAWWRVNLNTGETLGMTGDGRGQSLTEYTIMLYDNAFTLMFAMKSFNDCTKGNPSMEAEACCLAKAHISAIFGIGLGKAAGAGLGGIAGGLMGMAFGLISGALGTDFSELVPGGVC